MTGTGGTSTSGGNANTGGSGGSVKSCPSISYSPRKAISAYNG